MSYDSSHANGMEMKIIIILELQWKVRIASASQGRIRTSYLIFNHIIIYFYF